MNPNRKEILTAIKEILSESRKEMYAVDIAAKIEEKYGWKLFPHHISLLVGVCGVKYGIRRRHATTDEFRSKYGNTQIYPPTFLMSISGMKVD